MFVSDSARTHELSGRVACNDRRHGSATNQQRARGGTAQIGHVTRLEAYLNIMIPLPATRRLGEPAQGPANSRCASRQNRMHTGRLCASRRSAVTAACAHSREHRRYDCLLPFQQPARARYHLAPKLAGRCNLTELTVILGLRNELPASWASFTDAARIIQTAKAAARCAFQESRLRAGRRRPRLGALQETFGSARQGWSHGGRRPSSTDEAPGHARPPPLRLHYDEG